MTINTFKKLCLKSNTKKSEEIHDYFIKLEEVFQDIIDQESNELRNQLCIKEQELEEKNKVIEQLENKPETYGFDRIPGSIYAIEDTAKPGHIKLENAGKPNDRVNCLNIGSSTSSLKILATFETYDKEFAEKMIHYALKSFRIKSRNEWFFFKNDFELAYAINTIKNCIQLIEKYKFKDYNDFKTRTNI